MLSFLKTDSSQSRGRLYEEDMSNSRLSPYQIDAVRVTYSTSFRKLEYKTQVFFNNEGDYYRTRLTHSFEVAQISKIISKILGLNTELSEVVSLIHDLGHTPFGHSGEDGLNETLKKRNLSQFSHNIQSVRIVERLEKRYCNFDGLNLFFETMDGLIKHNGPIKKENQTEYLRTVAQNYNINLEIVTHLEGQIAAISDDIAYTNHDIEDGYRGGILKFEELLELPIIGKCIYEQNKKYGADKSKKMILYEAINHSIDLMINDVINNVLKKVKKYNICSLEDFFKMNETLAEFSDEICDSCKIIRKYLLDNFYTNPEMSLKRYKMKKVIGELFEFFMDNPSCLPFDWQNRMKNEPDISVVVLDFVSGMTDRYALNTYEKIR